MTTVTCLGPLVTVKDLRTDPDHDTLSNGAGWGLWNDGPQHPYRDAAGNTYLHSPFPMNYRFKIGNWVDGNTWVKQGPVFQPLNATLYEKFSNYHWMYGFHAVGNTIYSLTHHEWYPQMMAVDGHWGFNGYSDPHKRWVNTLGLLKSTNGGANFFAPANDASKIEQRQRVVFAPEKWPVQSRDPMYGFFHPTNIVKEGIYYYAFAEYRGLEGGSNLMKNGFVMVRTTDLNTGLNWQYWNGTGWTTVSQTQYQGNTQAQKPFVFKALTGYDPYTTQATYVGRLAQCIRFYPATNKWMLFGHQKLNNASQMCWIESATLANPQFETNPVNVVTMNGQGLHQDYKKYYSIFSTGAALSDPNFQNLNTPTIHAFVSDNANFFKIQAFNIAP